VLHGTNDVGSLFFWNVHVWVSWRKVEPPDVCIRRLSKELLFLHAVNALALAVLERFDPDAALP
jgi:hypothetical protein